MSYAGKTPDLFGYVLLCSALLALATGLLGFHAGRHVAYAMPFCDRGRQVCR